MQGISGQAGEQVSADPSQSRRATLDILSLPPHCLSLLTCLAKWLLILYSAAQASPPPRPTQVARTPLLSPHGIQRLSDSI